MNADDLATALTTGASGWMVLSVAAVLPILWAFTLSLHFARPYVLRFLQSLTLRFGGDVWWLTLRPLPGRPPRHHPRPVHGVPDAEPVPRARPADHGAARDARPVLGDGREAAPRRGRRPAAFRLSSVLLVVASALYIVPQVYGMEAADQVPRRPAERPDQHRQPRACADPVGEPRALRPHGRRGLRPVPAARSAGPPTARPRSPRCRPPGRHLAGRSRGVPTAPAPHSAACASARGAIAVRLWSADMSREQFDRAVPSRRSAWTSRGRSPAAGAQRHRGPWLGRGLGRVRGGPGCHRS